MTKLWNKKFADVDVGISVRVPVPNIDRAKGDQKNVIGVVVERTAHGLYRVGTKHGILEKLFTRVQIQPCGHNFVQLDEVPREKKSLWELQIEKILNLEGRDSLNVIA